jgi:hypothetical protein
MSDWTELREGDSSIKRVAQNASPQQKVQVAQTYRTFAEEADLKLSELVHSYNMYKASPRQVAGNEAGAVDCKVDEADCSSSVSSTASQQAQAQNELGEGENQSVTFFSQDD